MKLSLDWLNQVRNSATSQFFTGETFDQLAAQVPSSFHQEHTVDDKHATIHANGPIYERNRTSAMGVWLPAPFAASYFSAIAGSTWTVTNAQAVAVEYALVGSTMTVGFYIDNSTIGTAAASVLYITIPGNYRAIRRMFSTCAYDDNGTRGTGVVQVRPQSSAANSGMTLEISKDPRGSGTFSTSSAFAVFGQIAFEIYQTDVQGIAEASNIFSASGGVITTAGGNTIHTFTTSGTFIVSAGSAAINYLVVGGGGGGGGYSGGGNTAGGGGGGGAANTGSQTLGPGTYAVTVGAGGAGHAAAVGSIGSTSSFVGTATVTSPGGGGGGYGVTTVPSSGASGGGAGGQNGNGASATGGGHKGGDSVFGGAGGGGGWNAAGADAANNNGADGGAGLTSSLSGSSSTYAAGGGGGTNNANNGAGGDSSAGAGDTSAPANRGGGGGGGSRSGNTPGDGGSGVVIISYATP